MSLTAFAAMRERHVRDFVAFLETVDLDDPKNFRLVAVGTDLYGPGQEKLRAYLRVDPLTFDRWVRGVDTPFPNTRRRLKVWLKHDILNSLRDTLPEPAVA